MNFETEKDLRDYLDKLQDLSGVPDHIKAALMSHEMFLKLRESARLCSEVFKTLEDEDIDDEDTNTAMENIMAGHLYLISKMVICMKDILSIAKQ